MEKNGVMEPADLRLPPLLERLRPLLAAESRPVYVVGGTVRDALLRRPIHDIDLVVAVEAIPLAFRLADALGLPAYVLDAERDVGRVIVPGDDLTLDVARFRGPTLEDDLRGRDFTINALALPATESSAAVIDRHGGLDDLRAGVIRAIHERSLADDPVRALRAARFAAQFGFALTGDTATAARSAATDLPDRASPERIRDELTKVLLTGAPQRGVALLHELGLLAVVLPAVAALDGVAQSPPHHEDVLRHTLSVLRYLVQVEGIVGQETADSAAPDDWAADVAMLVAPYRHGLTAHLARQLDGGFSGLALLRWAGLLHDAGKAATQTIDADGRIRFLGHDDVGADLSRGLLARLAFSNEAVRHARDIVAGHMRPLNLALERRTPSRRTTYRYFRALHEAGLDVGLLALADHLATYDGRGQADDWAALLDVIRTLFAAYFDDHERTIAPPRLLDGLAIMALLEEPPGHEIGRLLGLLEEAQAAGEVNSRDEAIALVRRHHNRLPL
ncbi:putative Multifunctional CCA protein [Includes: CCA-adding enzyme; 2'-nucleotidase; 2',3'-cyclic phosphodiesterase; Phosphatase] [Candidatus Promineifilum breve]|uniref:Multifunctional CCA protein n=2 Tax=Candidatus Promineifilum breve TaxID=1806508 RepID=A0A170PJ53_9CHLR|nr:putative Multifunctional CCA protein [Includes: CCA-adding enzyme; 2'-nucleotidase; 2',3'-cyclic phosphodiesterase; Phosphatase] [Candidatus Promineifilum breve]